MSAAWDLRCRSRLCDLFFAAVAVHGAVGGGYGAVETVGDFGQGRSTWIHVGI